MTRPLAETDAYADTDVEASLRAAVRGLLAARCAASDVRRAYDGDRGLTATLWAALGTDLGTAGLLVPEDRGGAGATARHVAVVMEEIGRFAAPVPFLESAVIATTVLLAANDPDIGAVAQGRRTAVLLVPFTSAGQDYAPTVRSDRQGLHGSVRAVVGALDADLLLVPTATRHGGLRIHKVPSAEARVDRVSSLDMTRPLADVTLDGAIGSLLADSDGRPAVDRALLLGAAMLASDSVGVAEWALAATVEHLKQRRQFGRALGGFQALKHRLADLYVDVEAASAAARHAAACWASPDGDAAIATAVAASFCSDVAVRAAEEAVQLHGGIGMTWEHPTHLYLKRAKSNQLGLGRPEVHRAALASHVDLLV